MDLRPAVERIQALHEMTGFAWFNTSAVITPPEDLNLMLTGYQPCNMIHMELSIKIVLLKALTFQILRMPGTTLAYTVKVFLQMRVCLLNNAYSRSKEANGDGRRKFFFKRYLGTLCVYKTFLRDLPWVF